MPQSSNLALSYNPLQTFLRQRSPMKKLMLGDISFYERHRERLKKIYTGKYLLIQNEKVFGGFNTWLEASWKGLELFRQDSFLVKYCT